MLGNTREAQKSLVAGCVVIFFILFIFLVGVADQLDRRKGQLDGSPDFPDFTNYVFPRTLSTDEFRFYGPHDRIISIGDIHGMNDSLSDLLTELSYDPKSDTLIHLGDIVTRGGLEGSLAVLSFMSTNNIIGVRGNNDQKVVEWRAWRHWLQTLPGGRKWLNKIDSEYSRGEEEEAPSIGAEFWSQPSNRPWKKRVPKAWKLFERHYHVARAMSQEHYDYLRSLPSALHAPAGHTFFVHAGMLAADPKRPLLHPSQPLSHWPATESPEPNSTVLRGLQEAALLSQVPQNRDPWVLMNMRTVKKDGSISKKKKGTRWPELWNDVMGRCGGADMDRSFAASQRPFAGLAVKKDDARLPCFPSTVVYGHIASRGLDTKRWSIGLDSGCVYDRRLSALVLDQGSFLPSEDSSMHRVDAVDVTSDQSSFIEYGDNGRARIVSVKC